MSDELVVDMRPMSSERPDLMQIEQDRVKRRLGELSPAEFAKHVVRIHGDVRCECPWCGLARAFLAGQDGARPDNPGEQMGETGKKRRKSAR